MSVRKLDRFPDPLLDRQIGEFEREINRLGERVAEASADVAVTAVGTAGAAYTATEQTMLTALVIDVTAMKNSLNDLKAVLRAAGLMKA